MIRNFLLSNISVNQGERLSGECSKVKRDEECILFSGWKTEGKRLFGRDRVDGWIILRYIFRN
jgi:hypothetical protein